MKNIFRVSMLGLVITAFPAVSALAQTTTPTATPTTTTTTETPATPNPCEDFDAKNATYEKFRAGNSNTKASPRTVEKAKSAIAAGGDFLSKYGTCKDDQPVIDFINKNLPELKEYVRVKELYTRFDTSIKDPKNVNADEAYLTGKDIIKLNPALAFDVAITLAGVGFDNSIKTPAVDKYNSEALSFAKQAIKDIEAGKTSENYGFFGYSLAVRDASKKLDPAKTKQYALGSLNYIIASITYYNQKAKKDAIPYLYQTTKFDSPSKKDPNVYRLIGAWYVDELFEIDKKRLALFEANGNKDNEETLAMWALQKGYMDRAIDAYARSHTIAKASTVVKPDFVKEVYEKIQGLYKLRFDKTDGVDAHVAAVTSKPMPDPTTAVTPVVEEAKPAATTTGTTTSTTNPGTTKPAADTTTKPATTTTTKPAATDTTTKPATTPTKPTSTTTKPATSSKSKTAVKTTTKKKGTR